ncbi:YidC/Oxa1 family membrane protein insertase [Asanoa hainanensis]|uniref:Membrane protein insertase YidC n=1 Tax=Asanoa hainanensis TaxID=560556 RepID=A0A239PF71_9ACTN|nr:YidC/Oxa1 family membrane protein insertase [Asanoa hainanensis]
MHISLDWIYYAISWILLRWHGVWDAIGVPDKAVLGTTWSWILAIFFLVVTVRVILFPIFVKQIKSQRAMQALQPKVKELQEKHKGDRETLQKEIMELYRTEKANPLMGCLPMFLQIPVFLGLFHVLKRVNPNNQAKELYGWTAAQFDSASHATLFTAPISGRFGSSATELAALDASVVTVKVIAAILVAIMITTTYLTSRQMILKTGWAEDPQQRMLQRIMLYGIPASLLISGAIFPIGVIIYWVTNNLFTLAQQQWVLRKFPPPPVSKSNTVNRYSEAGEKARAAAAARETQSQPKSGGLLSRITDAAKSAAAPQPGATPKAVGKGAANGKPAARAKSNGAAQSADAKPATDGKALAPKPGAKPVNPKKAGGRRPAKRK